MAEKKSGKSLLRYFLIMAAGLMLGFGGIGFLPGQSAAAAEMNAQEIQTSEETTEADSGTNEESAVLFLVMGGGLIIILSVVITVVSTVASTVGAVEDEI